MKYTSIFANEGHKLITSLKQVRRNYFVMGFYVDGVYAGNGTLLRPRIKNLACSKYLQTESTTLIKPFLKKGHGIHLYFQLIETARKLGAKRIYSSTNLNVYSTKMWAEKLPKFFDVKEQTKRSKNRCSKCAHRNLNVTRYYIDLQ